MAGDFDGRAGDDVFRNSKSACGRGGRENAQDYRILTIVVSSENELVITGWLSWSAAKARGVISDK